MSVYPSTSLRQARTFMSLDSWEVPAADEPSEFFSIRGQGSDEVWDAIENLADALKQLTSGDTVKAAFDAQARELVHRHLAQIDEDVLSDADFWRYLSSLRFHDVVAKRHPVTRKSFTGEGLDGNWANFGALRSDVRESLFFRLFIGAELAYDEANSKDSYHLTKIHDVDLWQSHIVRVFSGDNPQYARSLLRWFQSRSEWYKTCTGVNVEELFARFDEGPETKHLRDLVKRVRRIRSNIVHEFLSEPEVLEIVEREALESLRNIESWGATRAKKRLAEDSK
jgi:hypothetical protein